MNKKGQAGFEKLIGFAIAFATLIVILVVTLMVLSTGKSEINSLNGNSNVSTEYNASVELGNSMTTFVSFVPIIVIAGIGAVLLGIVLVMKSRN